MSKEVKRYAERDAYELDKAGNYYCRHVSAMTGEGLHGKSDIAAELGWRDMQIDALLAENELLKATQYGSGRMQALRDERDALLAERDALKAEQALWEPIHYEIHRRAEKQWCLSSQCDFEVTVTYEDYAAIDAALQGEQP